MIGLALQYGGQVLQEIGTPHATTHPTNAPSKAMIFLGVIFGILMLLAILYLILVIYQWLWNDILVKYISILRPVASTWEFLLLIIGLSWLFGGGNYNYAPTPRN